MNLVNELFYGKTKYKYMENGFSEGEAEAMTWIAQQKAKGKFFGATAGLFMGIAWGHWHDRLLSRFRLNFSKRLTQLGIIMGTIVIVDYYLTARRQGANELFANNLMLNTNLLHANIDSLIENFAVYDRAFTKEQIDAFNYKRKLIKTNHNEIANKKWVHNPYIDTEQEIFDKFCKATLAPWVDEKKPANFSKILDANGDRLGIPLSWHFNWAQLH